MDTAVTGADAIQSVQLCAVWSAIVQTGRRARSRNGPGWPSAGPTAISRSGTTEGVAQAVDRMQTELMTAGTAISSVFADKVPEGAAEAKKALDDVQEALRGDAEAALRAQNELNALANAHPDLQPLANASNPLLSKLAGVLATVRTVKAEIAGLNAPAAPKPDTHWTGTFDAGKARQQFADEAKKDDAWRLRKKAAGLLKGNPVMCPGEAFETGAAVIAAEDEDDSSGRKGGRGRHPRERKAPKSEEEKKGERHDKQVKDEVRSIEEESRVQDAEAKAQGKSNAEKRTATELAKPKADVTSKEFYTISNLITKIENEKDALAKLEKQRQALADVSNSFQDGFADALDEIILKA